MTVQDRRLLGGVAWTGLQSWGQQAINFIVFAILARLLDATAFGLVSMASVFIHLSTVLVDQGMATAIVQRERLEPAHLDTAFWLSVIVGGGMFIGGLVLAEPLAGLFREPDLGPVIAILSVNFMIASLTGVQDALLRREFRFAILALRSLVSAVVGGTIGIIAAVQGLGVYALVAQSVVTAASGAVLLWSVGTWRPRWCLSLSHARELWTFGVNIVGMRLATQVGRRSDQLLIGYFLGAGPLGYYTIGFKIFKILVDVFAKIVSRAALPAFAALQSRREELRVLFEQALRLSSGLTLPSFVAIALLAADLVPLLFGEQWIASVGVLRLLVVAGVLQCLYVLANQLMVACGRPGWSFRLIVVTVVMSVVAFSWVARLGVAHVAAAYSAASLVVLPAYLLALKKLVGFGRRDYRRAVGGAVIGTSAMAVSMLAAREMVGFFEGGVVARVLVSTGAGVGVYLALMFRWLGWEWPVELRRGRVSAARVSDGGHEL